MPLRDALQKILAGYPKAKSEPPAGHPLGAFIRHAAAEAVEEALGDLGAGFLVEGSAGAGNWAAVPWISVFDPAITTSATHGYYVVYLFHTTTPVTTWQSSTSWPRLSRQRKTLRGSGGDKAQRPARSVRSLNAPGDVL